MSPGQPPRAEISASTSSAVRSSPAATAPEFPTGERRDSYHPIDTLDTAAVVAAAAGTAVRAGRRRCRARRKGTWNIPIRTSPAGGAGLAGGTQAGQHFGKTDGHIHAVTGNGAGGIGGSQPTDPGTVEPDRREPGQVGVRDVRAHRMMSPAPRAPVRMNRASRCAIGLLLRATVMRQRTVRRRRRTEPFTIQPGQPERQ